MLNEKIHQYNRNQLRERLEAIQALALVMRRRALGVTPPQEDDKQVYFDRLNQIIDMCSEARLYTAE